MFRCLLFNFNMDPKVVSFLKYSTSVESFIKEILDLQCKPFHKEWLELFEKDNFVSLLAPRGHGKTVIVGSYILWKIVINPDIRILIVTINQDKANEIMTFIQSNLANNDKLISVFGQQKGYSEWSRDSLRVYRATPSHKEPTLKVLGVTSSMIGGHYDIIILDDITDQKNSRTEMRRRDLVEWFNKTLMPMLEPEGKIISIGTKWHQADIHAYLHSLSNYTSKIYKAIIEEPSENNKEGKVLWPDRWSYEKLDDIRKNYGNVTFMMQYQNEYISDEESPIKYDWIMAATDKFTIPESPYLSYIGVDLAASDSESDYFVLTVITVKDCFISVADGYRGHLSLSKQNDIIKSYFQKWNSVKIGIEQAAQQKLIIEDLIERNPTLPIVPIKTSIVNDRPSRVHRLSVFFETGRISLNPKLVNWIDEMIAYPRGAHDDTLDSLSFALQASQDIGEKNIDWSVVPSLITLKKNKEGRMYKITKV